MNYFFSHCFIISLFIVKKKAKERGLIVAFLLVLQGFCFREGYKGKDLAGTTLPPPFSS